MKKATLAAGFLALGALAFGVPSAEATPGATPKILLHVGPTTTKNACTTNFSASAPNCAGAVTTGGLYTPNLYYLYVATYTPNFGPGVGVTGLQFGIQYNNAAGAGVDVFGWTLCATLEFATPSPVWPASGGGNLITWSGCQVAAEMAPAGYFYMGSYTPDTMRLTARPVDGKAKTSNCSNVETEIVAGDLGFAAFGGSSGCNPCIADCAPVPVESTTWSNVKTLLR